MRKLRFVLFLWIMIWTGLQLVPVPQTIRLAAYFSGWRPVWLPIDLDKAVHIVGYGIWAFLATIVFASLCLLRAVAIVILSGAVHGLVMELIQVRLTFRVGDAAAWAADLSGLAFGTLLAVLLRRSVRRSVSSGEVVDTKRVQGG